MAIAGGYKGKMLFVDLSKREAVTRKLGEDLARKFIGGRGFGARILYEKVAPGTDALGPENLLIMATGPLTGTQVPGSKMSIIAKSPASGAYGDSSIGGFLGPQIKFAGYDAIIIQGRSRESVYLWVENEVLEFRDAKGLWGKNCSETENEVKKEVGDEKAAVAAIGPAGERLVAFACITHNRGRQAGRCGLGAVMGSKNLKAVAVRGDGTVELAQPKAFGETVREARRLLLENPSPFKKYGTAEHVLVSNEWGALPTENYRSGVFEKADAISGETMFQEMVVASKACFGCPIACSKLSVVKEGPYAGTKAEGPEYETIAMLGSNCGVGDIKAIARANLLCDELGIDTISTGNVVAFAMECYERGIIASKDTGGLDLRFGNVEAYLRLIEMIGTREGLGETLSDGVRRAAAKFGKGSQSFAMQTKGLEWSGYECRAALGQALAYAVVDRGADHNRIWCSDFFIGRERASPTASADLAFRHQCTRSACDLLGVCRFVSYQIGFDYYAQMVSQATGWQISTADIMRTSEMVSTLTRSYNIREGLSREDDSIPDRCFEEPIPTGTNKGQVLKRADFRIALERFYQISGWDRQSGIPLQSKLEDLGLEEIVEPLRRTKKTAVSDARSDPVDST
jgi:aldehyde:ferredoxin oxidoreductase